MPSETTNLEKDGKCDEPAKKKPKVSKYTKLFLDKLWEFVSDSAQGVSRVLLLELAINKKQNLEPLFAQSAFLSLKLVEAMCESNDSNRHGIYNARNQLI